MSYLSLLQIKNFDLKVDEFFSFLGVIIAFGVSPKPRLQDHWSSHPVLASPYIVRNMTYKRFREILSCLHFADTTNSSQIPEMNRKDKRYDPLYLIRPYLNRLSQCFRENYFPHHSVSVDEAMIKFKGRSKLKQYMPAKPTKYGFKAYCV